MRRMIAAVVLLGAFLLAPSAFAGEGPCDPGDVERTTICHVPPGNPGNQVTLCVSNSEVAGHLRNHPGDSIGPCEVFGALSTCDNAGVCSDPLVNAAQQEVDICHSTGDGGFQLLTVAAPVVLGHITHGDGVPNGTVPGNPALEFDENCQEVLASPGLCIPQTAETTATSDSGACVLECELFKARLCLGGSMGPSFIQQTHICDCYCVQC